MQIRLILLDFDGTLADTRRANTLAYVATLREAGYTLTEEEYAAKYFGMRCNEFLTRYGIADPGERERLRLRKIALYPAFFDTVRLNRPLWEFCRQFRAQGGRAVSYTHLIQPVINKQLTLLTASYGMRIHPFYKTLQSHQGVDYTIPEGSRVFATADGVVRDVALRNSTSGQTVVIDHGNGYETSYSHLSKINVRKGQRVSRGEIIALSGDTGLSLSPHLHYEVRLNGMRVDPIHYFFMELTPTEYQRLMRIAQSGMQSFD